MPRGREGCLALLAEGLGLAIQEARAAPAIGLRSETDLSARFVGRGLGQRDCVCSRASSANTWATVIPKL